MKRNNTVINAQRARAGRRLLRWAATGMHFKRDSALEELEARARALLAKGPAFHQRFAALVAMAADDGGTVTQSSVAALVHASAGDKTIGDYYLALANERDTDRPMWAGWTYDTETESYFALAAACRAAAT